MKIKPVVEFLKVKGTWREVADSCNTTIGKEAGTKEPSSLWKSRLLMSEHSPIRQLSIKWKWHDLMYFVSVHITRHFIGILHYVQTQRTDRTGINRKKLPQDTKVTHEAEANAQAIINISRKRLCSCADPDTREAWSIFLESFKEHEPELYNVCVKECIYRGFCPEFKSCGYSKTTQFTMDLYDYRTTIDEK